MTRRPTFARRTAALVLAAGLGLTGLSSCSSSSDDTTAVAADTTAAAATDAAAPTDAATEGTDGAAAATEPASTEASGDAAAGGAVDCAAMTKSFGDLIINWQIIVGFSRNPDSSGWKETPIGTLSEFGNQVAVLKASLADNAAAQEAVAYLEGADAIVKKGIAGDAAAGPELASYIGTDMTKAVLKTSVIGEAMRAENC